jgi:hypothetical protein
LALGPPWVGQVDRDPWHRDHHQWVGQVDQVDRDRWGRDRHLWVGKGPWGRDHHPWVGRGPWVVLDLWAGRVGTCSRVMAGPLEARCSPQVLQGG